MELVIRSSQALAVTGASDKFATKIERGILYRLSANVDLWFLTGATGASAAVGVADNHFLARGQVQLVSAPDGTQDWFIHCIADSGSGNASLSTLEKI